MHVFRVVVFALLLLNLLPAVADDACSSAETRIEVMGCTWGQYLEADKLLNKTYAEFVSQSSKEDAQAVKVAQLAWIKFKEKYCQGVYDDIFPGLDAPIDQNLCLYEMTRDRTDEIVRIIKLKKKRMGYDAFDSFVVTLAVLKTIGYDEYDFLNKLKDIIAKGKNKRWNEYVKATCDFSSNYAEEDIEVCVGRLNFIYLQNYAKVSYK